jgi:hypothetical protein
MSRKDSYHKILRATSSMQHNISLILEAKASEASRSCQWICGHLNAEHYESHGDRVKGALEIHEQLLEVIDGLTKMEQALARHMQLLLSPKEDDEGGGFGGLGDSPDLFQLGGDGTK